MKCWGADAGALGDGTRIAAGVPVEVAGLAKRVKAIAAGEGFTCALTEGRGVECWGWNQYGELGDGSTDDSFAPVDVSGLASGVKAIAAGPSHVCAETVAGGVRCWGYNYADYGAGDHRAAIDSRVPVDVPRPLSDVATTDDSGWCALTDDGGVQCWGDNYLGQLGNGTTADSSVPVGVVGLASGVKDITAGFSHVCALTDDGGVKCWGSNELGQLGIDSVTESSVPVAVDFSGRAPTLDASGAIQHATGPTDVLLRYDHGPDRGELLDEGGPFAPGPEFTLYGDGTIIARDETVEAGPASGPIIRASPFRIGRLPEAQVQSLLRFALEAGGLRIASREYDTGGEGCGGGTWTYTLRVAGIDKRVEVGGCGDEFGLLAGHLRSVVAGSASEPWVPASYWGGLVEASILVELGALPKLPSTAVRWPWPDVPPAAFAWHEDEVLGSEGRRVMSAAEVAALGLSGSDTVVERMYLLGPDGEIVYAFSMWPMLPDETS